VEKGYGDMALEIMEEMGETVPNVNGLPVSESNEEPLPELSNADRDSMLIAAGIITESASTKEADVVEESEVSEPSSETLEVLLEQIDVMEEQILTLRKTITEMTTVGMCGVNMASDTKEKKSKSKKVSKVKKKKTTKKKSLGSIDNLLKKMEDR